MSGATVEFGPGGDVQIDAEALAGRLGLSQAALREGMRDGTITSRVERGQGTDAGRTRLTVFTAAKRLRLVVDAGGHVLQSEVADFGDRPLPPSMRRA
ncbi:hypothetical protein GI374_03420 [Paracoccus sp. S-4012]|uniref:DUF6522 family protein n=1 Tax=Paracoccus sp. S-4012 TaxID=2665648 RepID=UPI0012AF2B10|nr:hypothetical protein [Paracoccus sp. S-4012]